MVKVDSLRPHPRNFRTHPDDQLVHIEASMREHGVYRNVVVSSDDVILAGHGVVQAAVKLGIATIPVVRIGAKHDSRQALKLLTGDNEIEHLGVDDDRVLTELLKEIKETADGKDNALLGTGYDEKMLAALLMVTRTSDEIADFDAAAEWSGMPDYDESAIDAPFAKVIVTFHSESDVRSFSEKLGIEYPKNVAGKKYAWSFWYPPRKKDCLASVKCVVANGDEDAS